MGISSVAIVLYVVLLGLVFGLRSWIQHRRTGSTGFRGISGRPGSAEWLGGVLFVVALVLGLAAPLLDLAGAVGPIDTLDGTVGHAVGIVLAAGGIVLTLYAQVAMGESWRIGVDEHETTELVTDGPFALVRNPIFAAMLPTSFGLVLLVPSFVALAGFAALIAALELQTRAVEEPYLLRVHGDEYARYAERVGRFVPGVGRLSRARWLAR
jgi:protein-S-isoprenylcysteine O-methyltransferase Ste14